MPKMNPSTFGNCGQKVEKGKGYTTTYIKRKNKNT